MLTTLALIAALLVTFSPLAVRRIKNGRLLPDLVLIPRRIALLLGRKTRPVLATGTFTVRPDAPNTKYRLMWPGRRTPDNPDGTRGNCYELRIGTRSYYALILQFDNDTHAQRLAQTIRRLNGRVVDLERTLADMAAVKQPKIGTATVDVRIDVDKFRTDITDMLERAVKAEVRRQRHEQAVQW